ncbi:MAG: DUF542 domain-containing protein [Mitsuokella sp.]|uniref:DUF542 domain-containing protein n=1 Tax=uncultured Mitsuokella sp. TaxID=453120 RepID=UPI00262CFE0F|nr:DUF542 domain-containing protein [uncultured Mitsuokella sp.]
MITKDMTLAHVVKDYPQTIGFLNRLHLDYCCGGHDPIAIAVAEKGLDVEQFLEDLNRAASRPVSSGKDTHADVEAFRKRSIPAMLDDLEATHHVKDRTLMRQVEDDLNKILIVHYPHHGKMLTELHSRYAKLKAALEEHFAREERYVFPLMRDTMPPTGTARAEVQALIEEHTAAGDQIKAIQALTENFKLPSDACPTFRLTYQTFQDLFDDIFVHIFKENSIAFPAYLELR